MRKVSTVSARVPRLCVALIWYFGDLMKELVVVSHICDLDVMQPVIHTRRPDLRERRLSDQSKGATEASWLWSSFSQLRARHYNTKGE